MAASTLTSKGQVTIPRELRERLGLKQGDRLLFRLDGQGRMIVEPQAEGPLGRLPGLLGHLAGARPVTLPEMREAVRRRSRGKQARLRGR
jgi:AbrB family looped-hinge helix DNA binding protein